jgi:hypothetical protein
MSEPGCCPRTKTHSTWRCVTRSLAPRGGARNRDRWDFTQSTCTARWQTRWPAAAGELRRSCTCRSAQARHQPSRLPTASRSRTGHRSLPLFNSCARRADMTPAVRTAITTPGTSTRKVVHTLMPAGWPLDGSRTKSCRHTLGPPAANTGGSVGADSHHSSGSHHRSEWQTADWLPHRSGRSGDGRSDGHPSRPHWITAVPAWLNLPRSRRQATHSTRHVGASPAPRRGYGT